VVGFSALRAEKQTTIEKKSSALPKANNADSVSPVIWRRRGRHAPQNRLLRGYFGSFATKTTT
jgi:hypothetical protein